MKLITLIFLCLTICSFGQSKFKTLESYEKWLMSYYQNPQPQELFDGFNYGVHSKQITKAGNQPMIAGFFSAALRNDTTLQLSFYEKIKASKDKFPIFDFGTVLWLIHSDYSLKLLDKFKNEGHAKKFKENFDYLAQQKFIDLWNDPINHPEHLDMLWTDFFATANEASVKKIISKLNDLESNNYYDAATAGSAQWSLTSNSINHQKVLDICKNVKENSSGKINEALTEIVDAANAERLKRDKN